MPKLQLPKKMHRALTTKARLVVIVGGRSSAKSESVARIKIMRCQTEGADVLCGREYQNSIDDSVHKLLKGLVEKLKIQGVDVTEKKIDFTSGGGFRYKGFARNSAAVRSATGFKYSWIEEAQDLSEQSIEDLLPTIRDRNSQLWFTANPMASNDPFSKRFIVPFKKALDRDGFYEDSMHCIIVMNWRDNPWHGELEEQRLWDKEHMSRAKYDHIWEGAFNDTVEDSIIQAEWFDSAVDAHIRLGFKPQGIKVVSHDPSDTGPDPKGLVYRHGSVILDVQERNHGDVNDGCDWATDYALTVGADMFVWDCDGLGVSLKRQVNDALAHSGIDLVMFKGSEGVVKPDETYQADERMLYKEAKTNKETFKNKRAQYYWRLRDRFYNTYRAIEKGEYVDPDDMISISSNIKCMSQFRSEICRIPRKANGAGYIQIMRKEEMKRLLKIESPNLADSAMMSMEVPHVVVQNTYDDLVIPNTRRI